ncbi:thiamine pyrophosphate-binding protein [Blastococcus sp. URHD0036]|uniref:thiamine pyrophosphate-binding protein n=1 Tax=Blastococcus sp. URHD0036 TaxID=1380356 RepID=UPI000497A018|nr:thiamine pyrophosphate-binding protein [Blastococcus sp. URHD0036]
MQVHDAVARTLSEQGVDTLFGLMGDANMLYITDFVSQQGGRFVPVVDERSSLLMAAAYASARNCVGVATVTHGPALTHAMTGLVEATRGNQPVVLVTGDTPGVASHIQYIDVRAVAALAGAGYERVWSGASAAPDAARAFRRALTERRPIVLDVPFDLLEDECGSDELAARVELAGPHDADEESIDAALGLALSASRPVVLAGRGAVHGGARDTLVELAEHLGAPLATTLLARDLFRGHRLDLGVSGTVSTGVASGYLATADCVLAFGASLNQWTTDRGHLLQNARVVHVDRDAARLNAHRPAEISIVGDARAVAAQLLDHLKAAEVEPSSRSNDTLARELAEWAPERSFTDRSGTDTIDLRTAMVTLDRVLPRERNLVTDAGRSMTTPWKFVHGDDPRGFMHSVNFGSIGLGVGTAVGMAVARPDRPTVAVVGDGGFMQGVVELSTAVRERLPLIVVVANDGAYGAEWVKLAEYGLNPEGSRTQWPHLAGLAEAFGARGYTARTVQDLEKLEDVFADLQGPVLVDLVIDPAASLSD